MDNKKPVIQPNTQIKVKKVWQTPKVEILDTYVEGGAHRPGFHEVSHKSGHYYRAPDATPSEHTLLGKNTYNRFNHS